MRCGGWERERPISRKRGWGKGGKEGGTGRGGEKGLQGCKVYFTSLLLSTGVLEYYVIFIRTESLFWNKTFAKSL